MRSALGRVLDAWQKERPDDEWVAAEAAVQAEYTAVLDALKSGLEAYGFTTRLGHEDHIPMGADDQRKLLSSHLVGPASARTAGWRRLLACVKSEQLSHGSAGISPRAYAAILDACRPGSAPVMGNWEGSYSSGDVVPAAWWWLDVGSSESTLEDPGVLISAINGTFVSTAESIAVVADLTLEVGHFLDAYSHRVEFLGTGPLVAQLWPGHSRDTTADRGTQLPVSLRDAGPVLHGIGVVLSALSAALEHRLDRPSANPLFVHEGQDVRALSGASFLDFSLTYALASGLSLTSLLGGLWQRLIEHGGNRPSAPLQPPKVAQAYVERIRDLHSPLHFTGSDSRGVEDLRDQSLPAAQVLSRAIDLLRTIRLIAQLDHDVDARSQEAERLAGVLWSGCVTRGGPAPAASVLPDLAGVTRAP